MTRLCNTFQILEWLSMWFAAVALFTSVYPPTHITLSKVRNMTKNLIKKQTSLRAEWKDDSTSVHNEALYKCCSVFLLGRPPGNNIILQTNKQ